MYVRVRCGSICCATRFPPVPNSALRRGCLTLLVGSHELASAYDVLSDPQFTHGTVLIERLGISGDRVLDVGCGTGRLAAFVVPPAGPASPVSATHPHLSPTAVLPTPPLP